MNEGLGFDRPQGIFPDANFPTETTSHLYNVFRFNVVDVSSLPMHIGLGLPRFAYSQVFGSFHSFLSLYFFKGFTKYQREV
jgi:hypothetical protein